MGKLNIILHLFKNFIDLVFKNANFRIKMPVATEAHAVVEETIPAVPAKKVEKERIRSSTRSRSRSQSRSLTRSKFNDSLNLSISDLLSRSFGPDKAEVVDDVEVQ